LLLDGKNQIEISQTGPKLVYKNKSVPQTKPNGNTSAQKLTQKFTIMKMMMMMMMIMNSSRSAITFFFHCEIFCQRPVMNGCLKQNINN